METKKQENQDFNHLFVHASADNQYVTFQIGEELYGIGVSRVQEIIRYKTPTKVFNANPIVAGMINFRGDVIPIIDMHTKFSLPPFQHDQYTVIIVVEFNGKTMGLIVDRVQEIITAEKEQIKFVDEEFNADMKTEYLNGIVTIEQSVVMLLDPCQLMKYAEDLEEIL
jgi:purine-binding chemotaxis protein CheW